MATWLAQALLSFALVLSGKASQPAAQTWAKVSKPSLGPARAIGSYSNGCVAGASALPLRTANYAVAKPSRRRFYGHPELVAFIEAYAKALHDHRLGPLIVGDLGQARGGPAPSGHKSHQSGLDVDLWYLGPEDLGPLERLRVDALERHSPASLVKADETATNDFAIAIDSRLHRAALDPRVDRIFVHPRIKERLCQRAGAERGWLRKLRPWWGHDAHFHVRLACPKLSSECESQATLPAGDGCDELQWWFDSKTQNERNDGRESYRQEMGKAPQMPAQCRDVLKN